VAKFSRKQITTFDTAQKEQALIVLTLFPDQLPIMAMCSTGICSTMQCHISSLYTHCTCHLFTFNCVL